MKQDSPAFQFAVLTLLALLLGLGEVLGIGVQRDIGRGILAFIGAFAFAVVTKRLIRMYAPGRPDETGSSSSRSRTTDYRDLTPL